MTKICVMCGVDKPLESFRPAKRYAGGLYTKCRACESIEAKGRRESKKSNPSPTSDHAQCCRCGETKTADQFGRDVTSTNGLRSYCKDCNRRYQRDWATKQRASNRDYRDRHRIAKRRYQNRRKESPDQYQDSLKADRLRAQAAYHRKRGTPSHRLYARMRQQIDRARRIGVESTNIDGKSWQALLDAYEHCCAYCGGSERFLEMDHVVPMARGGTHTLDNIVPACRSCNRKKSNRTPEAAGMVLRRYGLDDAKDKRAA